MPDFVSFGLRAGTWSGQLRRSVAPGRVMLTHLAAPVAEARVTPDGAGAWRIEVALPAQCLSDGLQSFMLLADDGAGQAPAPGAERLAVLTLLAGAPLEEDMRAELDLIRAELDLLKREFRRIGAGAAPVSG